METDVLTLVLELNDTTNSRGEVGKYGKELVREQSKNTTCSQKSSTLHRRWSRRAGCSRSSQPQNYCVPEIH
ncbi:hypothetical protein KCV07_g398, partial [Aureobasidium melanogenum]